MSDIRNNMINFLDEFITNTKVSSATLITEDGLVIASNSEQNDQEEEVNINFAAISASILSMAEKGIEIINKNKILEQIKIDAGFNNSIEADFSILITRVFSNVLIQVIYPKKVNIGLIQFETSKLINEIKSYFKEKTIREEVFENLGSLL
ncbi:MAG: roadblock/LC7 domain-containing protein [Promethearchaeota archaeon]